MVEPAEISEAAIPGETETERILRQINEDKVALIVEQGKEIDQLERENQKLKDRLAKVNAGGKGWGE